MQKQDIISSKILLHLKDFTHFMKNSLKLELQNINFKHFLIYHELLSKILLTQK